jgi:MFS family permease
LYQFNGLNADHQWQFYLPTLLIALVITLFCIGQAERKQQIKPYFLAGIMALGLAECLLWLRPSNSLYTLSALSLFFSGFSLLEAFMPSLISRIAPAARKGSALGIYSCSQFFGIFVGGVLGGWLYGTLSFSGVYLFCIILALFWFILALLMQPLSHRKTAQDLDFIPLKEQLQSE